MDTKKLDDLFYSHDMRFEYDIDESYTWNLDKWTRWTNRERRAYKEAELTSDEAIKIFDEIFVNININKLDKAIKEASISIACLLDEASEVAQYDLEHIQKQIDKIEDEIKKKK